MFSRKIIRKKLFKKSLYKKRTRKSRKSYSIGDMVKCRFRSSIRRGSDFVVGIVVGKEKVFDRDLGHIYFVMTPSGLRELPSMNLAQVV